MILRRTLCSCKVIHSKLRSWISLHSQWLEVNFSKGIVSFSRTIIIAKKSLFRDIPPPLPYKRNTRWKVIAAKIDSFKTTRNGWMYCNNLPDTENKCTKYKQVQFLQIDASVKCSHANNILWHKYIVRKQKY